MIVDTGSHYTAFPCIECTKCGEEVRNAAASPPSWLALLVCRNPYYYYYYYYYLITLLTPKTGFLSQYHTDLLFDWTKSESFHKNACGDCESGGSCSNSRCEFFQSYTEGSSWRAFQSRDLFWIGRDENDDVNTQLKDKFALEFMFGCQYSETGLFIKQLANGIMGMSANEATIVRKLFNAKKLNHNLFTMCFQRHDYYEKEVRARRGA